MSLIGGFYIMRIQDIQIGESYRLHHNSSYGWVKAEEKLKPKQEGNPHTYSIVKCIHTVNKDDNLGFVRHYRPCDMVKPKAI